MISPGTIPLMLWNAIISGSLIGLSVYGVSENEIKLPQFSDYIKVVSYFSVVLSLIVTYPLFNSDRLQLKSLNTKDALLAVKSAQSYPESSLRYSRIGAELLKSGLPEQALEVGRSAVEFNPNSVQAWVLILANNSATLGERIRAKQEILRLDPFNIEVQKIVLQ
jgi:tetratricopeptide (TPR) repeat protein